MRLQIRRLLAAAVALSSLFMLLPTSAALAGGNPPGNNGTVKADSDLVTTPPSNEPHLGCAFQLAGYGFDQGNLTATVTMQVVAPTGSGVLVVGSMWIGQDPATGAGTTTGLDTLTAYDLNDSFGAYTATEQGYHVRVTVNAQGSQGSDKKFKTFWVSGCVPTPPPPPPPPPPGGDS